jgi:hypothetical protein
LNESERKVGSDVNDSYYGIVVITPSRRYGRSVPKKNGFLKRLLFDTTLVPVIIDDTGDGAPDRTGDYKNVLVVQQEDSTSTTDPKNIRSWKTKEDGGILSFYFYRNGRESTMHEVIEIGLRTVVRTKVVIRGYTTNDDAEYTHTMEEEKRREVRLWIVVSQSLHWFHCITRM